MTPLSAFSNFPHRLVHRTLLPLSRAAQIAHQKQPADHRVRQYTSKDGNGAVDVDEKDSRED